MADLPSPFPEAQEIPYPEGMEPQKGPWPKVQKMADGRLIVDWFQAESGPVAVVWENKDHPYLAKLPSNAPRATKQIYRREWGLKYLRAREAWDICADLNRAHDAWAKYLGR